MAEEIRSLDKYPTSLETLVMGPIRVTAFSETDPSLGILADNEEVPLPLSTKERGVYTCVNRGAKFSRSVEGGVQVRVLKDFMTRAPIIQAQDIEEAMRIRDFLRSEFEKLRDIAQATTRYGKLLGIESHHVGRDVYVRIKMQCGEAAGHNMTTKAATKITQHLLEQFPHVEYISDSGNLCIDKKAGAINAITGRGKTVITEIKIPRDFCEVLLRTTPELIKRLNEKKNYQGSIAAGAPFSANAHYANIVGAMYQATGQDMANVVEGSFGIDQVDVTKEGGLYFSPTQSCLIVGTIGNGKNGASQQRSLQHLGCLQEGKPNGYNSQRLAAIIAAATAMGELSLLADQTKIGRLIAAHERFER